MANTLKIKRGTAATIPQGQLAEPLFTTDTYDLYIGKGAGGNQRIQNYIASGTSSQFLKGDGSLDSTVYQATSEKGQNNGYASLDAGGKIPAAQLPSSVIEYKGTWNANTNTPTLADGTGDTGDVYIVSVGGTQNLGSGAITFAAGDWVMYNGAIWQKSTGSNAVASVNGQTGVVTITFDQLSPMTTLGDIIYGGASGAGTRLAGNTAASKRFLIQTGDGTNSAAPSWGSIAAGDVPTLNQNTTGSAATLTTARTFTIGSTGKTFDGSANVSWSLAEIGAQATLTNPVTGTGTNNYIPKFTATGSTIGDSSLYYSQGANSNSYTFGSVGAGAIYNLSQFNIYSNSTSEMFFQWGSNKYLYIGNSSGNVSFSSINTGTHNYNNIIYYNGASASDRYISFGTEAVDRLTIEQNGDIQLNKYTTNGFVKTSGGNGTLSVDTTSYLPLTGGTLTGALSGTSATFSGNLTIDTNTLYVDSTNNKIGIGTTAPLYTLQINNLSIAGATVPNFDGIAIRSGSYLGTTAKTGFLLQGNIGDNTSRTIWMQYVIRDGSGGALAPSSLVFSQLTQANPTVETERFRLSSTGNGIFTGSVTGTSGIFDSITSGSSTFSGSAAAAANVTLLNLENSSDGGVKLNFKNSVASELASITAGVTSTGAGTNDGTLIFRTASDGTASDRLTISSTGAATFSSSVQTGGNASIGITPYAWRTGLSDYALDIGSTTGLYFQTGGTTVLFNNAYRTTGNPIVYKVTGVGASAYWQNSDGSHNWNIAASGTAGNTISWTQAMTLTASGNVGIGTTSPSSILHIQGVSGSTKFTLQPPSGQPNIIEFLTNAGVVDARIKNESTQLQFETGTSGTPKMVITSGGATQIKGTLQTYTIGSTTTLGPTYKWGNRVAGTCSVSTTAYLEVEVGGTIYYLAFANPS